MSIPGKVFILLQFGLTIQAVAAFLLLLIVRLRTKRGTVCLTGAGSAGLLLAVLCIAVGIFTMW